MRTSSTAAPWAVTNCVCGDRRTDLRTRYFREMNMKTLPESPDHLAPDGSEVRLLVDGNAGGLAHFRLAAGKVSSPKQHRTVEELWYFLEGAGVIVIGDSPHEVVRGVSIRIPPATRFQFRSDGPGPLDAVGVTMPPWPGPEEAVDAPPYWPS